MKKIILLTFCILYIFFIASCMHKEITYKSITMNEAIELMNKENNYILLDARTKEEYDSGHIPGALNIPNEQISNEEIELLNDKDQLIFVYCRSGNRSKQASEKLAKLGYTNILEIGGIKDWPGEIEK